MNGIEIIKHQMSAMEAMDIEEIISDYAINLVSIIHADGKAKTLKYDETIKFMRQLASKTQISKVTYQEAVAPYGVMILDIPNISKCAIFVWIASETKIRNMIVYIADGKDFKITTNKVPRGKEVQRIMACHIVDMATKDPKKIVRLYDKNAVVITNLTKRPCVGRKEIYQFCSSLMKRCQNVKAGKLVFLQTKLSLKTIEDNVGCLTFNMKGYDVLGIEAYVVKNNRILFELSIMNGDITQFFD